MARYFWHDLRGAVRSLRKDLRFTVVASLTLALGVGAVTSIFSVVNGVLLKPLPYPDSERLVNVWSSAPGVGYDQFPLSPDLYLFYKANSDVFEDMGLFSRRRGNLTDTGSPEVVDVAVTTPSYFSTLGATPAPGRVYTDNEAVPNAPRVTILGFRFWTQRFGSDAALVGRTIRLDGEPAQVIGVAPRWLDGPGTPDLYLPTRFDPENPPTGSFGSSVIGRLKPGVEPADASRHLEPMVQLALEQNDATAMYRAFIADGQYRPLVHWMKDDAIGGVREPLWILLGTVGMVLLIACANVANLCLIRAEGRQREMAVRLALGAGRLVLVRQVLVEALVLSVIGSALGMLVSATALPVLLQLAPDSIPRLDQVGLDATVVLFSIGVAVISALVFGSVPAVRYSRPGITASLQQSGRGGSGHRARTRGRLALVVAQTAMALILLVGSGLLARSFSRMLNTDLGFEPANVVTFRLSLSQAGYPNPSSVATFQNNLVARLTDLPFVTAAGGASQLPMLQDAPGTAYDFDGIPVAPGQLPPMVHYKTITPGYFAAMQIPVLQGRDFDSGDLREEVTSVIINRALANQYWADIDPIGRRLRPTPAPDTSPPWFTVVGLVDDVRQDGPRQEPRGLVYFPHNPARGAARVMSFAVRGPAVPTQMETLRRTIWDLDADLPIAAMQTLDDVVEGSLVQFSFTMLTLGIAAFMALVLGAIGLYGVLSYAVSLRTREIGVRLALGAPPPRVMRSIVVNGMTIAGLGLVVGILGAVGLTRFLGGLLYETEALDPMTFAGMSAVLIAVALVASYLPARRAAAVSPMESMRGDGG